MKKSILSLVLLGISVSAMANDASPLPLYKDFETKEQILGCHGEAQGLKVVAVRNSMSYSYTDKFPIHNDSIGKVATLSGGETDNGSGVTLAPYNNEGSRYLPGNGEHWSYQSPNGTVLAAKGNYKAVFVYRDLLTQELMGLYYEPITKLKIDLECTNDKAILDQEIEDVSQYSWM